MRYFSSLPQKSFSSTIGNFSICSFFSYYEYNDKQLNTTTYKVDSKTTLTELSNKIYKDNNSIWLFLIANNTTDPFELLSLNPTLYAQDNINHITTGLNPDGSTATNYIAPPNSILTPFGATSGKPWEYSYVGNWNINGSFALIETADYFTGKMVVKEQKDGTTVSGNTATVDNLIVLVADGVTFSTDNSKYQTKNKSNTVTDTSYIVSQSTGKVSPLTDTSAVGVITDEGYETIPDTSGSTYAVTNYENIILKDKYINVIPPVYVNRFSLKTFNYT